MINKSHLVIFLLCASLVLSCNQNSSGGSSGNSNSSSQSNEKAKDEGNDMNKSESNDQTEKDSEQENRKDEGSKQKKTEGLKWNYSGFVGGSKIKANIVYEEATHHPQSGAISIPISGYYFYESVKVPMAIEGSCNGVGVISFVATTEGGDEYFEGNFTNGQLGDFSGTWSKGGKSLHFVLKSAE